MQPFPWDELIALGLHRLRLTPDLFWSLTLSEVMVIAGFRSSPSPATDRATLETLMARFPDDD